jgi:hypothetical protein
MPCILPTHLQQDERHLAFTEVAVGVLDRVVGRDSLRRSPGVPEGRVGHRVCVCVIIATLLVPR